MAVRPATNLLVVHCAATKARMDIGAAEIRRWHKEKGWADIGYHYVIRRNGVLEVGRDESTVGAHAVGHNARSIGICLVGGIDEQGHAENNFTPAQFAALRRLLVRLAALPAPLGQPLVEDRFGAGQQFRGQRGEIHVSSPCRCARQ